MDWDADLPMKTPQNTGPRYWLAKVYTTAEKHLKAKEYCLSLADFDPRGMTLKEAGLAGATRSLHPKMGKKFGAQVWHMAHDAKPGDIIFLESANRHIHAWGTIETPYELRRVKNPTIEKLITTGIHKIGVKWHAVRDGKEAFRIGKGDNLLFRDITKRKILVTVLRKYIGNASPTGARQGGEDAPQDLEYDEGNKVLRTHLRTERDAKAAKKAKELAKKNSKTGDVVCETCGEIPRKKYAGLDLIEAHHRIPLARGARQTRPEDFAMLCPCCHRAVHKLINADVEPLAALKRVAKLFA